jgi:hypothetical protein
VTAPAVRRTVPGMTDAAISALTSMRCHSPGASETDVIPCATRAPPPSKHSTATLTDPKTSGEAERCTCPTSQTQSGVPMIAARWSAAPIWGNNSRSAN